MSGAPILWEAQERAAESGAVSMSTKQNKALIRLMT